MAQISITASISAKGQVNKWPAFILFLAAGIFGICFYNLSITGFGLEFVPGDSGDSRFINYLLEHGYLYLQGSEQDFWNINFMYPQQNVLAFSDNMMGTLPVYGFYRLVGYDVQTAYQLWWISVSALNFICSYVVLRKLCGNHMAAVTGAFIFAFGLFNQGQMSYLQMNIRFAVPFIFYFAWMLVHRPSVRHYFLYCLWLTIQFYCVIYTGLLMFYLSLLLMVVIMFYQRNLDAARFYFSKKNLWRILLITITTGAALYLLFKPYIEISAITGFRYFKEVVPTLPLVSSYFLAHPAACTWQFLSHHSQGLTDRHLHLIFPGLLPFLAFFAGTGLLVYQRLKKQKTEKLLLVFFVLTCITFLLFTRTPGNYTLFALIFKFPGINSMRVLSRIMHVELFMLVLLLALLFVHFVKNKGQKTVMLTGIMLFILAVTDNLFDPQMSLRTPKKELQYRVSSLAELIKKQPSYGSKTILAVTNENAPAYLVHLDAMQAAQQLKLNCINGYSSYCPGDFGPFFLHAGKKELQQWMSGRIDTSDVLQVNVNIVRI